MKRQSESIGGIKGMAAKSGKAAPATYQWRNVAAASI